MMRATTLKPGGAGIAGLVTYYTGLAEDQLRRDGRSRGPIDYYLDPNEPPGRWRDEGCVAVGLSGEVRPEQLEAMIHGRHPGGGGSLGRGFGAKSARSFDATFSAPKSVSVLWALSPDIPVRTEVLLAHDAAVAAALDWLEEYGAVTRRGRNGVHQVDTKDWSRPLFRQHTSRDVDPQLHTHAVIWAKVQDSGGKWLSLDARFLKQQQRSIGWVYAAALRSELSARLGVSWGPVSEGHSHIDGVRADLLSLYSRRHAQVDSRLAELVAAWVDDHDGAEPDPRTLYRLERRAVVLRRRHRPATQCRHCPRRPGPDLPSGRRRFTGAGPSGIDERRLGPTDGRAPQPTAGATTTESEPMSGAPRDLAGLSGLVEGMTATGGHSMSTTSQSDRLPLMDLAAVAERLGVNQRHVRRLVAERRIPFVKWGHLLRFDPAEIEEWLDGARVRSGAGSGQPA
jgi:conjugative relaxase-like TrwC/TraI family protein/excisionase family DNA binding protein